MKYKDFYCYPKYSEGEKVYYGNVSGNSDIPMITAASLDDFEHMFHDAVDEYIQIEQDSGSKSKVRSGVFILLFLIALVVTMLVTCPKKEQHVKAISDKVVVAMAEQDEVYAFLSSLTGGSVTKGLINSFVSVDDYLLFSIGKVKNGEERTICSVGLLGHIFTFSESQINEWIERLDI